MYPTADRRFFPGPGKLARHRVAPRRGHTAPGGSVWCARCRSPLRYPGALTSPPQVPAHGVFSTKQKALFSLPSALQPVSAQKRVRPVSITVTRLCSKRFAPGSAFHSVTRTAAATSGQGSDDTAAATHTARLRFAGAAPLRPWPPRYPALPALRHRVP